MSDQSRYERIKEISQRAIELHGDARAAFLDEACASDHALRAEVEALLRHYDKNAEPGVSEDDIKTQQSDGPGGRAFGGGVGSDKPRSGEAGGPRNAPGDDMEIGGYRILREIDRGGMGIVYLGIKTDGRFQRRAAVKVVRRGMDTDEVLRRFEMERQVLSALSHPNIARLYDGGATRDGRPFFAMEFIEGLRIDDYCDKNRLSVDERIELFKQVCSAVQFAHRNLVVHRDIKPANIIVTAEGVPKLLDFGIAKLLNPDMSFVMNDPTAPEYRVMTPEYASPEQVRGETITTASDVYSLGVLLYELLTGHRPYYIKERIQQELERVICTEEPGRPSTSISRIETIPLRNGPEGDSSRTITPETVSKTRGTKPDSLRRRLSGDLDNIVMMALRKEPQRRYTSVESFAHDLENHQRGFPVIARPSSLGYRSIKFLRRNRAGTAIAALVLLACSAGVYGVINAQALAAEQARADTAAANAALAESRAETEAARADTATATAQSRTTRVRQLVIVLLWDLHDAVQRLPDAVEARKLIIETALKNLEDISQEDGAADPGVQRELAMAYDRIGDVFGGVRSSSLGDTTGAMENYRRARSIRAPLIEAGFDGDPLLQEAATNHTRMGDIFVQLGRMVEAADEYDRAFALQRAITDRSPSNHDARRLLSVSLLGAGDVMNRSGQMERAQAYFQEALTIRQSLVDSVPDDARYRRDLTVALGRLGELLAAKGQHPEAIRHHERALAVKRQLADDNPDNQWALRDIGISHLYLGQIHQSIDQLDDARTHFEAFLRLGRRLVDRSPSDARSIDTMVRAMHAWIEFLIAARAFDEIAAMPDDLIRMATDLAELDRANIARQRLLADCHATNASFHQAMQRRDAAVASLNEAIRVHGTILAQVPGDSHSSDELGRLRQQIERLVERSE